MSAHGTTLIVNRFEKIDENSSRWVSWCNFTFKGVMMLMSIFVRGTVRQRTEADMQRFKLLVASDAAGAPS